MARFLCGAGKPHHKKLPGAIFSFSTEGGRHMDVPDKNSAPNEQLRTGVAKRAKASGVVRGPFLCLLSFARAKKNSQGANFSFSPEGVKCRDALNKVSRPPVRIPAS